MPSTRARNYVEMDAISHQVSQRNGSEHSTKLNTATGNLPPTPTTCRQQDLPSRLQLLKTCPPTTPADDEPNSPMDPSGLSNPSLSLHTLDSDVAVSVDQRESQAESVSAQSDISLLSQEPPTSHGNLSSMATGGRSFRRGRREKVQSAAAVITEVQQTEEERLEQTDNGRDTIDQSDASSGARSFAQVSKAAGVRERAAAQITTPTPLQRRYEIVGCAYMYLYPTTCSEVHVHLLVQCIYPGTCTCTYLYRYGVLIVISLPLLFSLVQCL